MSAAGGAIQPRALPEVEAPGLRMTLDRGAGQWRVERVDSGAVVARILLPRLTDEHAAAHVARIDEVCVEAEEPTQVTIAVKGVYEQASGLRLASKWHFFPATGLVKAEITLHNPRPARHAGGLWDLGDCCSVLFRDFSLTVASNSPTESITYQVDSTAPRVESLGPSVEIYQDSSGGENWDSQNHVNREGNVTCRFRGYRVRTVKLKSEGLRAEPVMVLETAGLQIAALIPEFWQQFPKAMEAKGQEITLRIFPRQSAELFELQGGEQKTHCVWLSLALTQTAGDVIAALRHAANEIQQFPAIPSPSLQVPGLPVVTDGDQKVVARIDQLLGEFIGGPRGLLALREETDEYGWRNYGDLHADHEELHYHGEQPLISHYNNQFDPLCGFLLQFLRTGEKCWMELAHPLARHVIDIDVYRTRGDRPAYNGGLFWFTDHYLHARTSTHRTFSRQNCPESGASYGGGPGAEHNFTTGLLLYHVLTGSQQARDTVLLLANWVLGMDDGSQTILGTVDDEPTGLASWTGDPLYHGPGRGSGNSINALLDGWLLTHDKKYLAYAETLIQRCIHPEMDIASLDLLNAEKRWSYTVFLVSLSKYLACKSEAAEIDESYAYAQASLVHIGRWMLEHERPYFDSKDQLEYPTEAWPAQELRKANAIRLAALHADEPIRTQMLDRGDELAERAWRDLLECAKPTTARAMAVVMIEGLRDAELRSRNGATMQPLDGKKRFPPHKPFLPQRERIKRKLRSPLGLLSLLASCANPHRWPRLLNHR